MIASAGAPVHAQSGLFRRVIGGLISLIVGTLLCLNPVTSLIVLGWLSRRMRARISNTWGRPSATPGWILGERGSGNVVRLLGGIAANVREGVRTVIALGLVTLPFSAVWALSWWAGWNNSFTKGYEQAFVGPLLGITAVIVSLFVLALLPMTLAHFVAERRIGAVFEHRRIWSTFRAAGWRTVWLSIATALFVGPLLLSRAMPVFVEDIVPGFADMTPEQQLGVADTFALVTAAWTFAGLWWLRARAAAIYARSAPSAAALAPEVWAGTGAVTAPGEPRRRNLIATLMRLAVVLAASFAIPMAIYVGQFMNHSWAAWITNPVFLLPWMP